MNHCPKCQSTDIRKDGIVKDKQRYRCKSCNFRFTVEHLGKPIHKKRQAIILYIAGFDYRVIANLVNTSHVTIFNWINRFPGLKQFKGKKPEKISRPALVDRLKRSLTNQKTKSLLLIEFEEEDINVMYTNKKKKEEE